MAQARGPVRVLCEASPSHSMPPLLKTPLRIADCMTCHGAGMVCAPGLNSSANPARGRRRRCWNIRSL
eukprot:2322191-Heterocapsa_arctica.AAC.1